MLDVGYESHARVSGSAEAVAPLFELSRVLPLLRRHRLSIVLCLAGILLLAVTYLLLVTPRYLATSQIIVDTRQDQVLRNQNNSSDNGTTDTGLVDSQVEILNSSATALSVVQTMHLDRDPEFVGPDTSPLGKARAALVGFVKRSITPESSTPDDGTERAVEAFQGMLSVKRNQQTYVITIGFLSKSARKAKAIANEVAKTYIDGILLANSSATTQAGKWAQSRLDQLREEATRADQTVETFKSQNGIIDTDRGLLDQQQLSELNTQLVTATAAAAEAQARVERARELANDPLGSGTVSDALNNPVISRIQAQYLDLAAKQRSLAARLGPKHAAVLKLNDDMQQLQQSLSDQTKRVLESYRSDYSIAKAREDSLKASIARLVSRNDTSSMAQVKLRTLESTADSSRAMYNDFLQKAQQAAQQETFPIADARVVAAATEPLKPATPKTFMVLLGALAVGLSVGVGQAVLRDWMVSSFDSGQDVRTYTGIPCLGMLPAVAANDRSAAADYVIASPYSRYAEVLRNIRATMDSMSLGRTIVLGVTSAVPGEGKTTVAVSLARLIAQSGARTLLIDGDLSTRTLSDSLARNARRGLLDVIGGEAELSSAVAVDPKSGLHILSCLNEGRVSNRVEILASANMGALLDAARDAYDVVIIDLAPVVPVVDCKVVSRWLDMFLLVIEHRVTSRQAVQTALNDNAIRAKMLGAVLTKVDAASLRHHEEPFGKRFGSYYLE